MTAINLISMITGGVIIRVASSETAEFIEVAIRDILIRDYDVYGLAGDNVYPETVPQDDEVPAITYQQISGIREHTADGADGLTKSRFQINCWDDTYEGAKNLADAARKALDGYSGIVRGRKIQYVFLANEDDMPEVIPEIDVLRRFGKRLDFILMYDESLI